MKYLAQAVVLFVMMQMTAQTQDQTQTTVLKAEQLITYAADNYPADDPVQLYILVETGSAGIHQDHKFYIEQGVKLLTKRLEPEDKIAIGTYGAVSAVVLPFTEVSVGKVIEQGVQKLFSGSFKEVSKADGIALAYDLTEANYDEDVVSNVIMIRGSGVHQEPAQAKSVTSVYKKVSETNLVAQEVEVAKAPTTPKEERQAQRAQRKQAKAAEHKNLGGAIALTALTILPEILDVIKD